MAEVKIDVEKTVEVDWKSEKEYWNEYKLDDGSTLKVKLVLRGVRRAIDQHTPDGNPIYMINSQNVVRVTKVSKKLRKKPKKQPKSPVV